MLSQIYRFHGHGSLRYVYKNGSFIRSRLFTIKYTQNTRRKRSRYSVVVSKKIAKHAVIRNRIRRRVYEVLRTSLPESGKPHDVVIIISSVDVAHINFEELTQHIRNQLTSADILLPSPVT